MTTSVAPDIKTFDQWDWLNLGNRFNINPMILGLPDRSMIKTDFVLDAPCNTFPKRLAAETHFLFLGIESVSREPLTIMKWRELLAQYHSHPRFHFEEPPWYANEPFATRETCGPRWYAPLTSPVPNTGHLSDMEFEAEHLRTNEHMCETLNPIEAVTMQILHFWKYRQYTEMGDGMRASGRTMDGKYICVHCALDHGIHLSAQDIPNPKTSEKKAMAKGVRIPITQL